MCPLNARQRPKTKQNPPRLLPKPLKQVTVYFDRVYLSGKRNQTSGQKTEPGADFQNFISFVQIKKPENHVDHPLMNQKILAESLARPEVRIA